MIRHIPDYIIDRYANGLQSGSFHGFVLLFDLADFTPIGMELQKHGKQGAEELSRFLDFIFSEPISLVDQFGGFVSLFAGDAFCAIFPEDSGAQILSTANSIRSFFRAHTIFNTALGDFSLKARQTVTFGEIHWQIFENEFQNEYIFFGEPFMELAELAANKDELIFSQQAARLIDESKISKADNSHRNHDSELAASIVRHPKSRSRFVNPKYLSELPQNEIRSGAFCFVNLDGVPGKERERAIGNIQSMADKFGGFVNKYDATDKGLVGFILFGLPKSEGKTLQRICDFALELLTREPGLAFGIGCGTVYAGFTGSPHTREYTVLGHLVNLASRLMGKAIPGEIYTDSNISKELSHEYHFSFLGTIELKGIDTPVSYYRLCHRLEKVTSYQEFRFVGRERELSQIRAAIQQCLNQKSNTVIYVSGDPGIGKSRLVNEALDGYNTPDIHYFRVSCNAIIKHPLDIFKQILRSYFSLASCPIPFDDLAQFRNKWADLARDDQELNRIESIIASLLDIEWEYSVWSMLPPHEKIPQQNQAIVGFFGFLSQSKPLILHLDDGQWLDDDSKQILQLLSQEGVSPFVIVSPCRYQDDGSTVNLGLPKHKRIDLELGNMSEEGCKALIPEILGLADVPEETLQLIITRSMGNPLFVEQLSSYLLENALLDAQGRISGEVGYLSSFSISDIVCSRIDRLSENVRDCLYSASVLGLEFHVKVLTRMLNNDPKTELATGKSSRIWKDLDDLRYLFTHILIKDIVYQRMLSEKLQMLHAAAAMAMETVFADKLDEYAEQIALHYEKAGMSEKAAVYYEKAGCWLRTRFIYSQSESYLIKALQIREDILGPHHQDTAKSLHSLALLYWIQGNYDQAEPLYLRAVDIYENCCGLEHQDTAVSLHHLAVLYWNQGLFDKAEPLLLRTLQLFEQISGKENSNTAASLAGLGELYSQQGKYDQAEPLFLQALEIYQKVLPADHPDIATTLNSLAIMYDEQEKHQQAEPLHLRALAIREQALGSEHPDTAVSLNNLALLHKNKGDYDQAEPLYRQALSIFENVLGASHPNTAAALEGLAELLHLQGKYQQAELLYLRSLQILDKALGKNHPWTTEAASGLVELYKVWGKPEQAARYQGLYFVSGEY